MPVGAVGVILSVAVPAGAVSFPVFCVTNGVDFMILRVASVGGATTTESSCARFVLL